MVGGSFVLSIDSCTIWGLWSRLTARGTVLFTVSNLIISNVFPDATQSLAGAVFNTVAQFGNSLGLAIMADISSAASQRSKYAVKGSPEALLVGYRLVFWVTFGAMLFTCLIGGVGLRKAGKVGLKRD